MTAVTNPQPGTTRIDLRTVAVLGSGIMGSGIGAFFADRGVNVQLYDLERSIVETNLAKLLDKKAKPPMIMSRRSGQRNFHAAGRRKHRSRRPHTAARLDRGPLAHPAAPLQRDTVGRSGALRVAWRAHGPGG